jgi:hypothetical protein
MYIYLQQQLQVASIFSIHRFSIVWVKIFQEILFR